MNRALKEDNQEILFDVFAILSWVFFIAFVVIGILNILLVHTIPGLFYLLLSFLYFSPANKIIRKKLGFSIPKIPAVIIGLLVLWGTLAVSDLAEILGL